jgi:hypothetical protein
MLKAEKTGRKPQIRPKFLKIPKKFKLILKKIMIFLEKNEKISPMHCSPFLVQRLHDEIGHFPPRVQFEGLIVGSPICKLTPRSYLGKPWPFSPAGVKKRC